MRWAAAAAMLFAFSAAGQELILAEHGSVGLDPYTKFSYVTHYTPALQFVGGLLSYPLLTGSPSAALGIGDALYVGEENCFGGVCAPRVARHDRSGEVHNIGPEFRGRVRAIRLSSRGELVVATTMELARIDLRSGVARAVFALNLPEGSSVTDADVDSSGCSAAIAVLPWELLLADICGDGLNVRKAIPFSNSQGLWGVRFTSDGGLLVSGRALLRYDAGGTLIRTYDVEGGCRIEVTPDGTCALLACSSRLIRLDLDRGFVWPAVQIRAGVYVESIAFIQPDPDVRPRRRAAGH